MKRILITGKNSYVGTCFLKWIENFSEEFEVDSISLRDESWKKMNFSKYDVVYHVAGLAHIKETKENSHLYYKVNRDLTFNVAKKAKQDGVKHFIFLSSMSVYGLEQGMISKETLEAPITNYGISKLEAEKLVLSLESAEFKVAIIRPPMIYGKGSKGNYSKLVKLVRRTPFFPDVENQRSMLYIDNLSEFIRLLIINKDHGIFFPQNKEYVKTSEMVQYLSEIYRKKVILTSVFNFLLIRIGFKFSVINKIFGTLVYEKEMSQYTNPYQIRSFRESLELSELESGN